jgi:hypothetical protein
MKTHLPPALVILAFAAAQPCVAAGDALCPLLRTFVQSVKPDETKHIVLRTSWGQGFRGMEEGTLAAKACERGDDTPTIKLCEYWMENSSTEFAGVNAVRAIECLSPGTKFARPASVELITIHFSVGSPDRGSLVDITLQEDVDVGGMALRIEASGY